LAPPVRVWTKTDWLVWTLKVINGRWDKKRTRSINHARISMAKLEIKTWMHVH